MEGSSRRKLGDGPEPAAHGRQDVSAYAAIRCCLLNRFTQTLDTPTKTGTRIARNDNGKTYYVPADMTYEDWENIFVTNIIIR